MLAFARAHWGEPHGPRIHETTPYVLLPPQTITGGARVNSSAADRFIEQIMRKWVESEVR